MAFLVTATAASSWSLYNSFKFVGGTATPTNGVNLTSVTLTNNDPDNLFDRRITITGTGIQTDNLGNITAGNITGIKIAGLTGSPTYLNFTVTHALFGSDLTVAFAQFASSGYTDTTDLDLIFRTESYTFTGGSGDDFFEGSNVDDTLNGNNGEDVLVGLDGKDTINGGAGDDIIEGGKGDDTLNGGAGDDYIVTGEGMNVVSGGTGADTIVGGGGDDTITFAAAMAAIGVDLKAGMGFAGEALDDTYSSVERAIGSNFNDTLLGSNVGNELDGGKGNDLLMGRNGADKLIGGDGIDTASYAESTGVTVDLGIAGLQPSPGEAVGDVLTKIENLIGSDFPDQLIGDALSNRLDGGDGQDTLEGLGGADRLIGGSSNVDMADYGDSPAAVTVNLALKTAQKSTGDASGDVLEGIERVLGSSYNDLLIGGSLDDFLYGEDGNDALIGGKGTDTLLGGNDIDTVSYATNSGRVSASIAGGTAIEFAGNTTTQIGADTLTGIENLIGSPFNDNLNGNNGPNKIEGGGGNDLINGEDGNDDLRGGAGNDRMFGGFNEDLLFGDAGKDILDGAGDNDTLTGGADRDTFVYSSGVDTFTDFKAGTGGDYFDVRALSFNNHQEIFNKLSQNGANVEFDSDGVGGDLTILNNVQLSQLTAGNFLLH